MRRSLQLVMAKQVLLWSGCAAPTPQPPKIEGTASSVSEKDMRQVIALVEQSMRHEFGRVFAIDRIQVRSHNEIWLVYHTGDSERWVPVHRVHGVWTPPPENVWVTG
jgi:hypothetical protein